MCRTHIAYEELASGGYKELLQISKKISIPIEKWAKDMKRDCTKNTHFFTSNQGSINKCTQ